MKFQIYDIFELRFHIATNTVRVLYFFFSGNNPIITSGFINKIQKTPQQEIKLERTFRQDFVKMQQNDHF